LVFWNNFPAEFIELQSSRSFILLKCSKLKAWETELTTRVFFKGSQTSLLGNPGSTVVRFCDHQ